MQNFRSQKNANGPFRHRRSSCVSPALLHLAPIVSERNRAGQNALGGGIKLKDLKDHHRPRARSEKARLFYLGRAAAAATASCVVEAATRYTFVRCLHTCLSVCTHRVRTPLSTRLVMSSTMIYANARDVIASGGLFNDRFTSKFVLLSPAPSPSREDYFSIEQCVL